MHEVVCTGFSLFLLPLQALFELFQKADVLNPSLNCFVKFTMSLVDKVRIGTCNLAFVSQILQSLSQDTVFNPV